MFIDSRTRFDLRFFAYSEKIDIMESFIVPLFYKKPQHIFVFIEGG